MFRDGARNDDAQTGRFITWDTDLSQAPYLYCEGGPVDWVDPAGHLPDITGWPGRVTGLDFRFGRDDWNQIAGGIDQVG